MTESVTSSAEHWPHRNAYALTYQLGDDLLVAMARDDFIRDAVVDRLTDQFQCALYRAVDHTITATDQCGECGL
jgi:hypothetical protein